MSIPVFCRVHMQCGRRRFCLSDRLVASSLRFSFQRSDERGKGRCPSALRLSGPGLPGVNWAGKAVFAVGFQYVTVPLGHCFRKLFLEIFLDFNNFKLWGFGRRWNLGWIIPTIVRFRHNNTSLLLISNVKAVHYLYFYILFIIQ